MGRAKLPEARIEPRGVSGHVAQLKAEVRERARVAGAVGAFLAHVLGWTAFAGGTVAVLVWLAPPPRNPRLDEIRRLHDDFARTQAQLPAYRETIPDVATIPGVAPPATPDSSSPARAAKAERAAERIRAVEKNRSARAPR